MTKELELWQFVTEGLRRNESVMLLVVAESSGSSPGRQGYKMAVAEDGELVGSVGGGVMEVNLVEESRRILLDAASQRRGDTGITSIVEQIHRKDAASASGMICSGRQTVIFKLLIPADRKTVECIVDALTNGQPATLEISQTDFRISTTPPAIAGGPLIQEASLRTQPRENATQNAFEKLSETFFQYTETLGFKNRLYIVGGGHCALALSELMSKMDFHISLFDDRPELNTIAKNRFAHEVTIIDRYENIGDHVPSGACSYVVVMTLGYKSDAQVIRALIDKEFRYFGVLGSNAKMASMFKEFIKEGLPAEKLECIRTPVGLAINSRTPEEIAISIAAEMISVKNAG